MTMSGKHTHEPPLQILPFVEMATRGHCPEHYPDEDHERWLASLERRTHDPDYNDPKRPSIVPELSVDDNVVGPDLE
jgi:hypothetical protein